MSLETSQFDVMQFMQAAGQYTPLSPAIPTKATRHLRWRLIDEELTEFQYAIDIPDDEVDLVKVADALGDLLYVVLGAGVAFGIDLAPVFDEIHRSNMTKFIDGQKRPDGKWVKGPSYTPADLQRVLQDQMD